MYFAIGEWWTAALAVSDGVAQPHSATHAHSVTTDLRQIASAPVSASVERVAPRSPLAQVIGTTFDWSQPPTTRARVFAERLTDVRPVCVSGSRNDSENCLLDLPPEVDTEVSASRLMLAGCEASLPATVRATLARDGRDTRALEQAFSETFAAESQGKFSVPNIERRLTQRLRQMSSGMQRMLRHADVYIEIPRLTFVRMLTGANEARRHHIAAPIPTPELRRATGAPEVRKAMLGAYVRIPVNGRVHTLLVSLATPNTIERIREDSRKHAGQHLSYMFGDVPEYFQTARLQMRAVGPGDDIVHTLAELLHEGHQRYREFALGETREALAPESHREVKQRPCRQNPQSPPQRAIAAAQTQSQVHASAQADAQPQMSAAPASAREPRDRQPSAAEIEQAFAMLQRLDAKYRALARPRYG